MKSILILVGGVLVGYSLYTMLKAKSKMIEKQPALVPNKRIDIYTKTDFVPLPNPLVEHYDARPEVLFAPPMAYVYSSDPAVTDLLTPSPDF